MHDYIRRINYYETDQMHIVHHSNYIRFFEEARLYWMEKNGLDYKTVEDKGLLIPVLFVNAKYIKPAKYGDTIRIRTAMTSFKGLKFSFEYEILNDETKELLVTGESGHAIVDKDLNPVRLRRDYPDIYEKMKMISKN